MSQIPNTNTTGFPTTQEPTIQPRDDYFAGCKIFDLNTDDYSRLLRGSNKWDRWDNYFGDSKNSESCKNIRSYLYRNPDKTIVLRNMTTQDMVHFKPKSKGV